MRNRMNFRILKQSISAWLAQSLAVAAILAPLSAKAQSFTPPQVVTSVTAMPYTGNQQIQAVAADASGNVYYTRPDLGKLLEQPANGGAVITLATGLSYPKGVAVDNAGNAYVTDYSGKLWKVPAGGGTPVDIIHNQYGDICWPADGGYLGTQVVAVDGAGNVYTAGNNEGGLFKITPSGTCSAISGVTLTSGTTNSYGDSHVAADAAGNLYYSIGASLYTISAGASTPVLVTSSFNSIIGLRTDAAGNVFVSNSALNSYSGVIDEVPFVNGAIDGAGTSLVLPIYTQWDPGVGGNGAVYTTDGSNISMSTLGSLSFPATAAGTQSAAVTVNLAFNNPSALTLSALQITSGAGPSTEVANTGAGTCTLGASYSAGQSCTLTLALTPAGISARNLSVQLLSGTTAVGELAMTGRGSGAGLVVDPATQNNIGSGWQIPSGIAIDGSGNLFVADKGAGTVSYLPAGSTAPSVIASSLSAPAGVAVAADGTVYVADSGSAKLFQIPYVNGVYGTPAAVMTGLNDPVAVAVAGSGDLYLADAGAGAVYRLPNDGGAINFTTPITVGSGFTTPSGLVVDASNNLYIADKGAGKIFEIASGAQSAIVAGLNSPLAVAIDAGGSLYVTQSGSSTIERVPFVSGAYNLNAASQLGVGLQAPSALAADNSGNLYLTDASAAAVTNIVRTAGALNFGKVNVSDSSADESLTLSSIGDLSLTFGTPLDTATGNTGDFSLTPACTAGGSLASGSSCLLSAVFSPTGQGTRNDLLTFSSNAVNAPTITGTLTGTGTSLPATTTTLTQTTSGALTFGETVQFSATVAPAASGTATPDGTVQFFVNGVTYGAPVSLASGTATVSVSGLLAGATTIGASYSGNASFAASSAQSLTVNVALAATTTTLISSASSSTPIPPDNNTYVTLSAQVNSSGTGVSPSGSVSFMAGSTVLGTAPVNTSGAAVFSSQSASLPLGTYTITAVYSGDAGFAASTSNAVTIAILQPQFNVSGAPAALNVSTNGSVSGSFVLTPISGYTGGVDFACTGLPANTTCTFDPAEANFAYTVNASKVSVPPGPQTINMTINTSAPAVTTVAWLFPVSGLALLIAARKRRILDGYRVIAILALSASLLAGAGLMQGCAGSANNLTSAGTSTVTVTMKGSPSGGTSGVPNINTVKTFTFSLTVK